MTSGISLLGVNDGWKVASERWSENTMLQHEAGPERRPYERDDARNETQAGDERLV
ncbi:MAG: hypothetical protein ACYDDI_16520 [Candidatus Acidiferrales bacterium]